MNHIEGIYAGKEIWASSYDNGEFTDWLISPEMVRECNSEYITSDIKYVTGQSRKEIALAYYANSIITKNGKEQNHQPENDDSCNNEQNHFRPDYCVQISRNDVIKDHRRNKEAVDQPCHLLLDVVRKPAHTGQIKSKADQYEHGKLCVAGDNETIHDIDSQRTIYTSLYYRKHC